MEQQMKQADVSFTVHESDMARADRNYKRLWMTLNGILAVIAAAILIRVFRGSRNETCKGFTD